jgi:hypothetical protein
MKANILIILLIFLSISTFSQKSAPVAGDAAKLIDLLKKDYNGLDPETKDETISRDMFRVISIFKTYLSDNQRIEINKNSFNKINFYFENQEELKEMIVSLDSTKIDSSTKLFIKYDTIKQNYNNDIKNNGTNSLKKLNNAKNNYFEAKYLSDTYGLITLAKAYSESENIYLSYIIKKFIKKFNTVFYHKTDYSAQVNYNSSIQKALPFLGGDLAFETVIDGLSKFLVKRIKEELTTHAIEKIQKYLNNPSQKSYLNGLLVILPRTTDYLKTFEASQILNFTNDFKQYIEKDLNNLLENASNLQNTPRFQKLIERNPDVAFAFDALELIPQISKIKQPLDYFKILENSKTLNGWALNNSTPKKHNIANSIKLTSLLAHSLLVIDDREQKLVSLDFMSNYGSEKEFYLLYIGFLHQQNCKYFNVNFMKLKDKPIGLDFKGLMKIFKPEEINTTSENILFFKEHLTKIVSSTEKLQEIIESVKKRNKDDEKIKIIEIHSLVETLLEFSEEIALTADDIINKGDSLGFFDKNEINITEILGKITPYFNTAKSVNNIFLDLHSKNYTTALISTLEIASNFTNKELSLEKLTYLKTQITIPSDLTLIKTFLDTGRIPRNDKKKEALIELAIRVEQIINYSASKNGNLKKIKEIFKNVHKELIADKNSKFTDNLELLKNEIKEKYTEVLEEWAQIDLTKNLLDPYEKFIKSKKLDDELETKLIDYSKEFTKNTFKAFVLNDEEDLKKTKKEMLFYFSLYLPELSNGVFHVKDKNLLRLIHFITDIAIAESSEDVEIALEAFALPAGSSSIKEKTSMYVSINSYPGILFGKDYNNNENINNATNLGITAPIGIYTQVWQSSWGLFIPIIDIGAPLRFRFDDDNDTESLPDFDFNDIFSPGAYITYGLKNAPFAFNAGIQYGPKLRNIENDAGIFSAESYRLNISIVIDIPLFTLFNSGID